MTCCLCGTKPFPEPVWIRLHLDPCKLYVLLRTITTTLPGNWYQVSQLNNITVTSQEVYDISNHCLVSPLFRLITKYQYKHVNHFEDGYDISNNCSFSPMFRLTTKKTSKPTLLTLCTRNPSMTGGFLAQRVSKHVNHFEDGYDISNHCSFSPMFRLTTKKTSKPTLLTLCTRNPSMTGGFLAQRVSKHVNHFEDGYDISNHCSFSPMFRLTTKKTSKPTLLTLCTRNPSMTGGFLAQRVSILRMGMTFQITAPSALYLG